MSSNDSGDVAARLERIEGDLKVLADAVVSLARVEERMAAQAARADRAEARLDSHDKRLVALERTVGKSGVRLDGLGNAAWLVLSAAVGAVATMIARGGFPQ